MTVITLKTNILENLNRNKVLFYGELASLLIQSLHDADTIIIDAYEIDDCKILTGTYVLETTGMYFKKGLLVQAMLNGSTFVVLNIDKNIRLYNYLQSVIETNIIYADGIITVAHENFKIIYTSSVYIENKHMLPIGPLVFSLYDALSFISESFYVHRDVKDSLILILKTICSLNLESLVDSKTFIRLYKLIKLNNFNIEMLYENFYHIFLVGFEEMERAEKGNVLKELLYISKQQMEIKNEYIFDDFYVNDKNIGSINSIIRHIRENNPVLITGETGVGKTTLIQTICKNSNAIFGYHANLIVLNMSQDVDMQELVGLYESYPTYKIEELKKKYNMHHEDDLKFLKSMSNTLQENYDGSSKADAKEIRFLLNNINRKFIFKENLLLKAIKNGDWLLFDEINLASDEVLNALNSILEKQRIYVLERGDLIPVKFHKNFRVFGCMNPGNDYGKRNFTTNVFCEVFYDDFSKDYNQLLQIANKIIMNCNKQNQILKQNASCVNLNINTCDDIAKFENLAISISMFFIDVRTEMNKHTLRGNEMEPIITGRTFTRLIYNLKYSCIFKLLEVLFYSQFCVESYTVLDKIVFNYFTPIKAKREEKIANIDSEFFVTKKNKRYISMIEHCVLLNFPIILQGPTSTGKTSSIYYLARKQNIKLHRINNHENTEIGDYLGNYKCRKDGTIFFEEGILIQAMINGDWLLLDELNLAQSEVLEVLNRLLDDNREIMCNNKIIRPHKKFRLFATQNLNYSGRKRLSRAFRNRFIEIFFDKLYIDDIKELLFFKSLPSSYIALITDIYDKLSILRSYNDYMTVRDIFKWISGNIENKENLFITGLSLICEKQRCQTTKESILSIFENTFKLERSIYYNYMESVTFLKKLDFSYIKTDKYMIIDDFVFTKSFIRLFNLLHQNYIRKTPVLIIGETGIGKTKCIELLAKVYNKKLHTIGMHENIDSCDFIGNFVVPIAWNDGPLLKAMKDGELLLIDEINLAQCSVVEQLNSVFEKDKSIFVAETNQYVSASEGFRIFACMNPGTDFGKKELSPALRNRFTEIFFEIDEDERFIIFEILLTKKITNNDFCYSFLNLLKQSRHILKSLSLRKTIDIIANIESYFCDAKKIFIKNKKISAEFIYQQIFVNKKIDSTDWDKCKDFNQDYIGINPYFIIDNKKDSLPILSKTTKQNMNLLLKALLDNKPILLKGKPGVGKTSFIMQLAKHMNYNCVRINLSEETEFYELCGSYMPKVHENNLSIDFVYSELVEGIQNNSWIVLDEINLATQTVIEGLNSLLDHRREIYLDKTIKMTTEARIFATMNDFSALDGRKTLPKSFLDRFKILELDDYNEDDIFFIINKIIDSKITKKVNDCAENFVFIKQRENIKLFRNFETTNNASLKEKCCNKIKQGFSLRNMFAYLKLLIDNSQTTLYEYENNIFTMKTKDVMIECECDLDNSYVIVHKNINQLMQILVSITNNVPVIITGNIGKSSIINFVSKILNMSKYTFYCHNEIDCNDLLGQFTYINNTFQWQNSFLIDNCIKDNTILIFDKPEHIQKAVFDRLNALFERQEKITIHEKGIETKINVGSNTGIVLLCNDIDGLSNAIIDRCWRIDLSDEFDTIDINKIISTFNTENHQIENKRAKQNGQELENYSNIDTMLQFKNMYNTIPITNFNINLEHERLSLFENSLSELQIRNILQFNIEFIELSDQELEIKERHNFNKLLEFYKKINYDIKTHDTDFEKLKAMRKYKTVEKQIIAFMKNRNLSIFEGKPKPENLDFLKYEIYKYIVGSRIKEYRKTKKFTEHCLKLHIDHSKLKFDSIYYEFIAEILGFTGKAFDPLLLIKIDIIDKYNTKIELLSEKLKDEFMKLYKYGRSNIENISNKLSVAIKRFKYKIQIIENKLHRNLVYYIQDCKSTDHEICINQLQATNLFSDICDYSLLQQYSTKNFVEPSTLRSLYMMQSFMPLSKRQILFDIIKKYNVILGNDFCQNFLTDTDTFCEMLFIEDKAYELDVCERKIFNEFFKYNNDFFDCVFKNLFMHDDEYRISFCYEPRISVTKNLQSTIYALKNSNKEIYNKLKNSSIMNATDTLLENCCTPELQKYYQSCTKFLDWKYNYSWYIMLYLIDFTKERITEYLLNTEIYQYFERQYFIKLFLKMQPEKKNINLLYNISLQYEAFEIGKKYENHKESIHKKLWYDSVEFYKYKKILQENTLSHINTIHIDLEDFKCECMGKKIESDNVYINNLIDHLSKRSKDCLFFINEIEDITCAFHNKYDIADIFYTRTVINKYNNYEIQLGKVFNEYIQMENALEEKHNLIINGLLFLALKEDVCINVLLFIHQILEKNKKYDTENDGDGLKEGTGEKNISENIKDDDEICEDVHFEEIDNVDESDGVEISNEGCIDSVSNESEYSSKETVGCEEETAENNNEESADEVKNCDLNEDFKGENESIENEDIKDEENLEDEENNLDEDGDENEVMDYRPTLDNIPNEEQTCDDGENYESHVKGTKEEKNGLQEDEIFGNENFEDKDLPTNDKDSNGLKVKAIKEEHKLVNSNLNCTKLVNLLKYVFVGNKKNKYSGDYRSGKKLNMKKIIPFILSDYKKDKIWLKRNRMEKREYIIRIFVDNSQSMNQRSIVDRLSEIFTNLTKTFEILDIPIEIYSFGASLVLYKNKDDFFEAVKFNHSNTNTEWIQDFRDGVNIILTDGIFQVHNENNCNFILLLINNNNIYTMKKILVVGNEIITKRYIDSIKLRYCIINDYTNLEDEFVSAVKELVSTNY